MQASHWMGMHDEWREIAHYVENKGIMEYMSQIPGSWSNGR